MNISLMSPRFGYRPSLATQKAPWCFPSLSVVPIPRGNQYSDSCHLGFCFACSWTSYKWNQTRYINSLSSVSVLQYALTFLHGVACVCVNSVFSLLGGILLYRQATICWTFFLLIHIWASSSLGLLWIRWLHTFLSLRGHYAHISPGYTD